LMSSTAAARTQLLTPASHRRVPMAERYFLKRT
jgi:hypothetical protein